MNEDYITKEELKEYMIKVIQDVFPTRNLIKNFHEENDILSYKNSQLSFKQQEIEIQISELFSNFFNESLVGMIMPMFTIFPPNNCIACDGRIVNIEDYPVLAKCFEDNYGFKNYFGGDGETTFAVPDLRNNVLENTGNNTSVSWYIVANGIYNPPDLYKVSYYYNAETMLYRQVVFKNNDSNYLDNIIWSNTEDGPPIDGITKNVQSDLDLYLRLNRPEFVLTDIRNSSYDGSYVVEEKDTYLIFVNASSQGKTASVSSTGEEKYTGTWGADSNRKTCIGIYNCDENDVISFSLGGNNNLEAAIIKLNIGHSNSVTIVGSSSSIENRNSVVTSSTEGLNIGIAFVSSNASYVCSCELDNIEAPMKSQTHEELPSEIGWYYKIICMNTYLLDNTLTVSTKSGAAYATSGSFIFNIK